MLKFLLLILRLMLIFKKQMQMNIDFKKGLNIDV